MAIKDPFQNIREDISAPCDNAFSITPADSDLAYATRAVYVGGAGDLVIETVKGDVVTLVGVLAGSILPLRVKQVRAATTATNIIGLY